MELKEFKQQVIDISPKMYRFARRLLGQEEEAKDSVQDAMLRLWKMRDKLGEYRSIEALAIRITKNICLDKLKSKRNYMLQLDGQYQNLNPHWETPEKHTELNNTMNIVSKAMQQLPEQQQMIIQLRDIEEMEFTEIAEILGMEVNTIRVNLSRARKKMRTILTQLYNYGIEKN